MSKKFSSNQCGTTSNKRQFPETITRKIFETNCSLRVKCYATGNV